jgi:hypothetical protein
MGNKKAAMKEKGKESKVATPSYDTWKRCKCIEAEIQALVDEGLADARYGSISTVNLIKKLGELTCHAHIFIQNNAKPICPLENIAMLEIEQKCR